MLNPLLAYIVLPGGREPETENVRSSRNDGVTEEANGASFPLLFLLVFLSRTVSAG